MVSYRFVPRYQYIADISQAQEAVVTFDDDHDYKIGEILSFRVPKNFGMQQMNYKQAKVLDITDDTITINVDTLGYNPFILATDQQIPAMCVPSASSYIPYEVTSTMILDDCFDNVRT